MSQIVHLCAEDEWRAALEAGEYRAASMQTEGFIHCSRPEQILAVANRFYPGQRGLAILWIDMDRLESELRWELSDGQIFPHLYGPLNIAAVRSVFPFSPDADGVFRNLPAPG